MKPRHRALTVLACAIGLGLSGIALADPPVTVRVTSIGAALRDIETIVKSARGSMTRDQLLKDLASYLGVQDLSFLDLSRPAAVAIFEGKGFVVAVPVRDGVRALEVLAKQFPEHTLEGDLTVLRQAPVETAEGPVRRTLYAALRGRVLVIGQAADLVRSFDHPSALSGENLPPGSLALSMDIEPVAARMKTGLDSIQKGMLEPPPPAAPPGEAAETEVSEGTPEAQTAVTGTGVGSVGADQTPFSNPVNDRGARVGGTAGGEPILVVGDVAPPELLVKVQPDYPEAARRARIEGKVILEAIINTSGEVENLRVLRSIPALDDAAIDAVSQWKYRPARQDGRPVKVFFTVIVEFTLKGPSPGEAGVAPAPSEPHAPLPFEPRKLVGLMDLYFGFMRDTIDSLSKLQVSLEVSDGFLIVRARGVARQGSTLAGFIEAQRDVGLPAIGRMMPVHAPVIVAGQLYWTDPARAWLKGLMQRYQSAMADLHAHMPESEREAGKSLLQALSLWNSGRIIDCQRGDLAFAMDYAPDGIRTLQVAGLSDSEGCRDALASAIAELKAQGGQALVEPEVLEPENVTTYSYQLRIPKTLDASVTMPPEGQKVRLAEIGDIVISGSDEWASRAIREAASAREGSPPGSGGLVLADLGPFTQRPGVFGRMQLGTLMRQLGARDQAAGPAASEDTPETPEALIQALEGPAGAIPFAMRFDEGAATLELALPLAMLDAYAANAAKPAR